MATSAPQKKIEGQVRLLQRIILAEQSMKLAAAACDAELNRKTPISKEERDVIAAGIVAYYASPFTAGNGIGALSSDFGKFDDPDMAKSHSTLLSMRDQKYAHRDKTASTTTTIGELWPVHAIEVNVDKQGNVRLSTRSLDWPPEMFEKVRELCRFQMERIKKKGDEPFAQLVEGANKPAGTYILGENFP